MGDTVTRSLDALGHRGAQVKWVGLTVLAVGAWTSAVIAAILSRQLELPTDGQLLTLIVCVFIGWIGGRIGGR